MKSLQHLNSRPRAASGVKKCREIKVLYIFRGGDAGAGKTSEKH